MSSGTSSGTSSGVYGILGGVIGYAGGIPVGSVDAIMLLSFAGTSELDDISWDCS